MFEKNYRVHFVGIGGIGMSALALIVIKKGFVVTGSDLATDSLIIEQLRTLGACIYNGHNKNHIDQASVVVRSSAIREDNPEIIHAHNTGIPIIHRSEMLCELMRSSYSIGVTGMHGKTTTTAMISHILYHAGIDPTIICGGILHTIGTNAQQGNGLWTVAEVDESDRSLLQIRPTISVITNINEEHLDTYRNIDDIKETFANYIQRHPFYGAVVMCIDNDHVASLANTISFTPITYSLHKKASIMGTIVSMNKNGSEFAVKANKVDFSLYNTPEDSKAIQNKSSASIFLPIPGEKNVSNALGAIACCLKIGISLECIKNALETFSGVARRFEHKGTYRGADVYDDYGHHPEEIKQVLAIANTKVKNKMHVVFQPHRFTRTQKLWHDFVNLFTHKNIAQLYLLNIYPASEDPIAGVTSKALGQAIQKKNSSLRLHQLPDCQATVDLLAQEVDHDDLVITIGAGNVFQVSDLLVKRIKR